MVVCLSVCCGYACMMSSVSDFFGVGILGDSHSLAFDFRWSG